MVGEYLGDRMKILMIMGGFFPGKKYGGPPVSVDNFCSLMKNDECYIITHNHDKGETSPYINILSGKWISRENCYVMYLSDSEYTKNTFETVIKELHPDLIYLQGLFQACVLPCLNLAKAYKLKVLLAPRGELCAGAFKKKYKKLPYIFYLRFNGMLKNIHFQATSDEEKEAIIRYLKAKNERIHFLTNIPSIPKREYIREEKHSGSGKFVFLSRIHPKKNLISAIRYFRNVKGNVVFDIYGPVEDENYWSECLKEIETLPANITVNYCGLVSHDDVHDVFSKYDAFIFPTFSENYGHVIAEALVVGTSVIISNQTPWTDVNEAHAGWAISLENTEGFSKAIQEIVDMEGNAIQVNISKYIQAKLKLKDLQSQYKNAIEEIIA